MNVEEKHPEYFGRLKEWSLCTASLIGETAIKSGTESYLPKPQSFNQLKAETSAAFYKSYQAKASFPDTFSRTVDAMLGIIHDKRPDIQVPPKMEYLLSDIDGKGTTLTEFHKQITLELLVLGRVGVLSDVKLEGGEPYLAKYKAASIINWDNDFVVLDESGKVRNEFHWDEIKQHRVLSLVDGAYVQDVYSNDKDKESYEPKAQGGSRLDSVPFTFINTLESSQELKTPPLIGVARALLAYYQLSADYRQQLYMSGQGMMVALNGDAPTVVGAHIVHEMTSNKDNHAPDLKYVKVDVGGIQAHEAAMLGNKELASEAGSRLLQQSTGNAQESGKARGLRFKSETASIQSISQASASGIESALRNIADFLGVNRDEVIVTPNPELISSKLEAAELKTLHEVYLNGGMSWQTYHSQLQSGGYISPETTADEEYNEIQKNPDLNDDGDAI